MPEICDFTWISWAGTICPIASAFLMMVPGSTRTVGRPFAPALARRL